MNFKKIDPVILAKALASVLALVAVAALVGWAMYGLEKAKQYEYGSPVERALIKDGLL